MTEFFKWEENTMRKGEIALYQQFLLFPKCFKNFNCKYVKTRACLGKGKVLSNLKTFTNDKSNVTQNMKFCISYGGKIVGNGENAAYQHFLLPCFQQASPQGCEKFIV